MILKLNILKIKVGIVIVAKLKRDTKIRVIARIIEAIRYNIQPIIPREEPPSTDEEAAEVSILPRLLLNSERAGLSFVEAVAAVVRVAVEGDTVWEAYGRSVSSIVRNLLTVGHRLADL